jgi:hypothetical protein
LEDELRLWASYRGQTLTRTGTPFASSVIGAILPWQNIFLFELGKHYCAWFLFAILSALIIFAQFYSKRHDVLQTSLGASVFSWYGQRGWYSYVTELVYLCSDSERRC